jgi:hypothetical protein
LAVKLFFFSLDPGYRDERQGGSLRCAAGPACVYARYLAAEDGVATLTAAGVSDVAGFTDWYWDGQMGSARLIVGSTTIFSLVGGLLYTFGAPRSNEERRTSTAA